MKPMEMSRRVTFSSGHRYWNSALTPEQNLTLFGPWASPFNHGHNYVLWATVRGEVNPETGMIVNIKTIDSILKERIVADFDQHSLNDEIPEFANQPPSLENLLVVIGNRLNDLPPEAELVHLRLDETELLYAELDLKQTPAMTTLTRIYEFAAAHRLHSGVKSQAQNTMLYGKCNNPEGHGHNYVLEVTITGEIEPETGMMASISELDQVVHAEVVDRYDHKNLNRDIPEFQGQVTTSEVVAQTIWDRLVGTVPARLHRVRLYETPRNVFEVTG